MPHIDVTILNLRHVWRNGCACHSKIVLAGETGDSLLGLIHVVEFNGFTLNKGLEHIIGLIHRRNRLGKDD